MKVSPPGLPERRAGRERKGRWGGRDFRSLQVAKFTTYENLKPRFKGTKVRLLYGKLTHEI